MRHGTASRVGCTGAAFRLTMNDPCLLIQSEVISSASLYCLALSASLHAISNTWRRALHQINLSTKGLKGFSSVMSSTNRPLSQTKFWHRITASSIFNSTQQHTIACPQREREFVCSKSECCNVQKIGSVQSHFAYQLSV